jgi:hypothetical protein
MQLHVYANSVINYVVAESLEEAKEIATKECLDNGNCSLEEGDIDGYEQVDDDEQYTVNDEEADEEIRATCRELCSIYGKGFLMSTEY